MDIEIETFLGLGANQKYIIEPIKQKIALQLHRKKLWNFLLFASQTNEVVHPCIENFSYVVKVKKCILHTKLVKNYVLKQNNHSKSLFLSRVNGFSFL